MANTMATLTVPSGIDHEHAFSVIEHVTAESRPFAPGTLQIVRLLQRLRLPSRQTGQQQEELVFAAKPGSRNSSIRRVHIVFMENGGAELPAPELAEELATIRLFYPITELHKVTAMVVRRGARFCYFWRSADAARVRAWLFTPQ